MLNEQSKESKGSLVVLFVPIIYSWHEIPCMGIAQNDVCRLGLKNLVLVEACKSIGVTCITLSTQNG
jgi:hypothetical protein